MEYRTEHDSMGEVRVPADKLWGAQTQRSFENFKIGEEKMPLALIHALAEVKLAAARANAMLCPAKMTAAKCAAIEAACREILDGKWDGQFPLVVWQTGSGTQTNMNLNEVIAHRAGALGGLTLHPNDDVNLSQSSNDVFPTAMHVAAVTAIRRALLPALDALTETLRRLEAEHAGVVKCGRTHLQDATPIAFSQEISGWRASLETDRELLAEQVAHLSALAIGGTAVGTGLNAPKGFGDLVARYLSEATGEAFTSAENKFHALSSRGELAAAHGVLAALAGDLMKIANDVRWLAGGPRCGLGEITIPENEPGSSIMPGKVNPTQCEAITMIAAQVMGNNTTVSLCAAQGNFELNVFLPVLIYNFLQSVRLLADGISSFDRNCVAGIRANREKMRENLHRSLMTATALTPRIGYENAAKTVQTAHRENISLREACVKLGFLTAEEFDQCFHPEEMI